MGGTVFRDGMDRLAAAAAGGDWTDTTGNRFVLRLMRSGANASMSGDGDSTVADIPTAKFANKSGGGGDVSKVAFTGTRDSSTAGKVFLKAVGATAVFATVSNGETQEGILICFSTGTTGQNLLLAYTTFTANQPGNGGNFTVTFNTNGLIRMSG